MNWISYFMYAIILTCLTGSIWTLIWFIACGFLKKHGNAGFIYNLLKFAMAGYFVPILFVIAFIGERFAGGSMGHVFTTTPLLRNAFKIVVVIWLLGVIVCGVYLLPKRLHFLRIRKNCVPISGDEKQIVAKLCKELDIKTEVRVYHGYQAVVPFIYGIRRPRIYLPEMEAYSYDEKEMILMHELMHFKHKDVFWKPVFMWVCCVYWFNPLSWIVFRQFQRWAEASCDVACCKERYHAKDYFGTIYKMLDTDSSPVRAFAPTWHEGKSELKWRVENMKRNKNKGLRKWTSVVVAVGVVLMSSISTYASEAGMKEAYDSLYKESVVETEEATASETELVEYIGDLSEFDDTTVIEVDMPSTARASAVTFDWTLKSGVTMKTVTFSKSAGDTIYFAVSVEPGDESVKVGIIQPDDTVRYVYGLGNFTHTFALTQTGQYRFFITNTTSSKITVVGYYK